jgi:hypothetical protein
VRAEQDHLWIERHAGAEPGADSAGIAFDLPLDALPEETTVPTMVSSDPVCA